PILSTSPENIKDNLRLLVENPSLRKELGEAGRKYVEKYHSYKAFQYMFSNVYKKIIEGKDIDLINLFHPLKSAYNNSMPKIKHPLFENKIKQKIVE
ncbi:MAG: aminotransferase, partial [Candidatus Pacebacteria bacterium]|nr:aminotransferase [Candidatus Paceibacterota bacterium]